MAKIKDYIRADTRIIKMLFTQSDGVTPLDLTGGTVTFTISTSKDPAQADIPSLQKVITSHVVPSGVPISSGFTVGQNTASLGISWAKIVPSDTSALAAGTYYYDYQAVTAGGDATSHPSDIFIINADITR